MTAGRAKKGETSVGDILFFFIPVPSSMRPPPRIEPSRGIYSACIPFSRKPETSPALIKTSSPPSSPVFIRAKPSTVLYTCMPLCVGRYRRHYQDWATEEIFLPSFLSPTKSFQAKLTAGSYVFRDILQVRPVSLFQFINRKKVLRVLLLPPHTRSLTSLDLFRSRE